jgi:chromosome segregation ATPase
LGKVVRFLIRLLLVLIVGALIGLGLFYGVPWVYRRLTFPVQENSVRIAILEEQVAKNSENIFDNHRALQQRIVDLETEMTELQEDVAVQARDREALAEESERLAQRITALEDDLNVQLETQQQAIEQVQSSVADTASDLEQQLDGVREEMDGIREDIEGVREQIEGVDEQLEAARQEIDRQIAMSEEDLRGLEGALDEAAVDLGARLSLLQIAQDLTKVRLLLVEENPGVARDTLALAIAHLDRASELIPSQGDVLDDLRERMLAVDDLIAENSFRTRPNLEALWADVMDLAVPLEARSIITGTEGVSPLPTPTPAP